MEMTEKSKALKSELIRLSELAYKRELSAALQDLEVKFVEWKTHKIDSLQLNEAIHRYHKDTAKELWHKYVPNTFYDLLVVQAVARGVLKQSDLSPGLLQFLRPKIRHHESDFPKSKGVDEDG